MKNISFLALSQEVQFYIINPIEDCNLIEALEKDVLIGPGSVYGPNQVG